MASFEVDCFSDDFEVFSPLPGLLQNLQQLQSLPVAYPPDTDAAKSSTAGQTLSSSAREPHPFVEAVKCDVICLVCITNMIYLVISQNWMMIN